MADEETGTNGDEAQSQSGHGQSSRQPQSDGGQSKLEALLEVLTSRRRRYALYFLQDRAVTDLEDLATHLTAIERGVPESAVSDDDIVGVRTDLLHADLPVLANAQLLEFDRRSGAIRYAEPPPLLEWLLQLCAEIDAPDDQPD